MGDLLYSLEKEEYRGLEVTKGQTRVNPLKFLQVFDEGLESRVTVFILSGSKLRRFTGQ